MKTLNLYNPTQSEIPYTISHFRDGEASIDINTTNLFPGEEIVVTTPLHTAEDLFIFAQVQDILRNHPVHFTIGYMIGGRNDRRMSVGRSFSLRTVMRMIMANHEPHFHYEFIHPHNSEVIEALAKDLKMPATVTITALYDVFPSALVVFPDAGAWRRFHHLYPNNDHIIAAKKRDIVTGEISYHSVVQPNKSYDEVLIVDDIIDTGETLIKVVRGLGLPKKTKLTIAAAYVISHKSIEKLEEYADNILYTLPFITGER